MQRAAVIAALSAAIILASGCVNGTPVQRRASISPYATTMIGGESLEKFFSVRTAFVFTADHLPAPDKRGEITLKASENHDWGVAAAIDSRGYFLTASHCVGEQPPILLVGSGTELFEEKTTVVWRGNRSKNEPDLALLWVGHPVSYVFNWGGEANRGNRVFEAGADYDKPPGVTLACISGVILPPPEAPNTQPATSTIHHTAPMHDGDSGGPLTDTAGQLLGINVATGLEVGIGGGKKYSEAVRPDLKWLNEIISAHASKAPNKSP